MTLILTLLYIWGILACGFILFATPQYTHPVSTILCIILWPIAWVVGMVLITIGMLVIGSGWVYSRVINKCFKK